MINFQTTLTDMDGNDLLDEWAMRSNGGVKTELTLGRASANALCATYNDEADIPPTEKYHRAEIAMNVREEAQATLGVEDIALIKRMIGKFYGPIVVYRAFSLLDPNQSVVSAPRKSGRTRK